MAAEYRGFDFGRKAEIALLDRRKRLKNHDVVFKRRAAFEASCGLNRAPTQRAAPSHRRRRGPPARRITVRAMAGVAN
jgi:ferric-dicitrate binding protein FerR (iron transport regulator)